MTLCPTQVPKHLHCNVLSTFPNMFNYNRRQFLQFTGGLTLATLLDHSIAMSFSNSFLELRAWHPNGEPLDVKRLDHLYFLTMDDDPIPEPPRQVEVGKLLSQVPSIPFGIAIKMPVEGFGEVYLYADNQGKGYTPKDFPLDINLACASSRIYRVRQFIEIGKKQGIDFPKTIINRLEQSQIYLKNTQNISNITEKVKLCNDSLRESLWAGEEAVFAQAKQLIKKQSKRPNFLFGGNSFNYLKGGEEYIRRFKELFNLATVPFYWSTFEAQQNQKNFAEIEQIVKPLNQVKITVKGHPLVWFHEAGIPVWAENKSFAEIRQLSYERVIEITKYYGDQIPYYDIINEAHGISWANRLNYSFEQLLDLTKVASQASRIGNPQVNRIINNCCLWGENVSYAKPPQQTPYQYLKSCIAAEIPFEIIGLQLYYPDQDMLEINRLLEKYSQLGKTIHITELGVSSASKIDQDSYLKETRGLWHEPWNETVQADWIEQFYTLCYSKPYIKAISWWDLADIGNFWPHGGLLNKDLTPKESFYRLKNFIQKSQDSFL
ncbi:endo-1,4-beta-xylanase [Aphanothece sacrum]|uniref:endo-1,4-beta-xylanase n=1 Tax=Aphanothece sacrum FPU1 TaxID=1920663 RepID=A0A401IHX1_APHSA|nr:endo-1,4-beta-xylanase [Aphanothece sacrum]GBF80731.1 endo-1,4-beta-xylanase [Aphanothece sacrum FPU1]GBF83225.1 endo-1,4-beta-xylanase [Aphanothece sacrum FPU3]